MNEIPENAPSFSALQVRKHINDLYEDLRDGHNLISLLEVLSGVKLPREKGRMRFHRLQNVQIALDFLKQRQVKLVNIRNDDITDGNPKLTLGLIWTIILHFQCRVTSDTMSLQISDIYISGESGDMSAKEKLLLWTQKVTAGYVGVKCTNFSSCWSDGKMFNALIHRYRPDMVDMERVQIQSNRENLEQAFEVAERLGVTRLLDAEDVDVPSPDEKSVITYVSSIYDAFPKVPEGGDGISAIEVDSRWLEYQNRVDSLIPWIKQHTILMSDTSFPQNPVELKALYNQYIHFKETEIPTKEQEKGRIEELYKLLEVWIEFGRIKLPQGYHPNDVEEEWGKLIIEMLEREKSLRPAVERLELLLQIANKIQNGALSCEEKLTLARNTLQAYSGDDISPWNARVMYLRECEGLIRQLQVDVQILRDENYYQLEELVFRIVRLQDELVTLRLECTNLYRKGHFSTLELVQPSTLTTTHLKAEPLTKGTHTSSTSWFRKPMTRAELVAISSSEDEGNLRFVYELLSWVEEMQMKLERAEWGSDLPSVESQLETQRHVHSSVEDLGASVKEARMYEGKMSQNFRTSYTETLGKLETQYCKLMGHWKREESEKHPFMDHEMSGLFHGMQETSSFRLRHLQSLYGFVSRATAELIWLNEKEEEELAYDWSDNNPNIAAKRNYFSELTMELEEKQDVFRSLQDTAELLSLENHPAKQTVEAYSAAVQSQWQWIKQLCLCVDQHVKENAAYFQFFSDARESETYLRSLQDSIKRKYSCDQNTSLTRLEDLLQDSMDEKEQLIQSKSSVASLVGRSKTIVQLKPRNPDHVLKSTISVKAVCDYRQIEITICKNDECVLEDNSQRTKWKVISPTGNEAMVPSVCFLIPPPNKEAIDIANRVEQLYQKVMALWHQLHVNTKSLISWNYLRKDIALVQGWNMEKLRSLAQGECQQAMKSLQAHYEDFLHDSQDSELFSGADRLCLEEEVKSCKEHFQHLLESMENEDKDETIARAYLSELKNIRLRLEECEQRLVRRIQAPSSTRTDGDAIQENTFHIAEQERMQEDLRQLKSDLQHVSEKCDSFLHKSPTGSSAPHLRSELNLLVEKMDHVYGLSSIYLDKLKTVDVIVRSTQGAESLVKGYEVKLSQEEAVPADLTAIQSHRATLQQWLGDAKNKSAVFSTLEEDVAKAKITGEQLYRLKQERSMDLERYQEKGAQLWDRWQRVGSQIETRCSDLESIQEVLGDYRECHGELIQWIEETTAQQELMKPGQAEDSKVLSEQLSQQTALVVVIDRNQAKLDQCQKFSQQYSAAVKDYELQLMTYRAFVESQQKSPMKRRRMLSSSDAITQEKAVEEEKQEHVDKVKELLGWVSGLKQSTQVRTGPLKSKELGDIEKSISEQQALNEELAARKEQVSEAIKTAQIFLAKHSHKLSDQEKEQISTQLSALKDTYHQLCSDSAEQFQQLQSHLAQETEHKGCDTVAGVIDLGTVEIFPIFGAMQKGLIDQDTGLVLLEAQVITSGLVVPETNEKLSLAEGLARDIIDPRTLQLLQELQDTLLLIRQIRLEGKRFLPTVSAIEEGKISEDVGLKILEVHLVTGGFLDPSGQGRISLEKAVQEGLITTQLHSKLASRLKSCRNLIDPNTAKKISLTELMQRCIIHQETGLRLLPIKQLAGGMVSLKSGRKVSIFRAVQEGLIDRQVTVRLLEAQLFAGGIVDPRTGHRLTVDEAVRHNLIDQDMACALLIRQLQTGGIIDTVTGERLTIDEAVKRDLVASRIALVILESLWSFMGLLWPESGEILPVADALEQGILSTELAHKILSNRQLIKALFIPETTEVLTWKKAVEHGILDRDVAKKLKSTVIPDVMPSMQLAGSAARSKLSVGSAGRSHEDQSHPLLRSDDDRLIFHLMTHSYINIHNGQKLLLVDGELNDLTKACIQAQENGSSTHLLDVNKDGYKEEKEVSENTSLDDKNPVIQIGSFPSKYKEKTLNLKEQEEISAKQASIQSEINAESAREQRLTITRNGNQIELSRQESANDPIRISFEIKPREAKEMLVEMGIDSSGAKLLIDEVKDRAPEMVRDGVRKETYISMDESENTEKPQIMQEKTQRRVESEIETQAITDKNLLTKEKAKNRSVKREEIVPLKTGGEKQMEERETEKTESARVLEVEETDVEDLSVDFSISETSVLPKCSMELGEDRTLTMLVAQLQDSKETLMRKIKEELISSIQESVCETTTKKTAGGLLSSIAEQKQTEISEKQVPEREKEATALGLKENIKGDQKFTIAPKRDALQETIGEIRNGKDTSVTDKSEEKIPQAMTKEETSDLVSTTVCIAERKMPELITGEESTGKTPQEITRDDSNSDQEPLLTMADRERWQEPSRESTKPAKIVFSKQLCLEHDEKLVSYLSMLRDIEMKIKQVQPSELNLGALQDLLHQAEVLDVELKDLSSPVNQELDSVKWIVANQPQEVPEQLLKALEKDAKNLQKSFSSVSDALEAWLLNLRSAAETEKAKVLTRHKTLEGKLEELQNWVCDTALSLDSSDYHHATEGNSLTCCLQHYKELKRPLAHTKSELDAAAFNIQFFISEHAQDLTPQQSRQLLRLLNELQKSFRDLSERVAAQVEVLQVCLRQVEQTDETLQEQQAMRSRKLEELHAWLGQAENTLRDQQRAANEGDLPMLQQRQSDVKDLQRNIQSRAASFVGVLKATEEFLEENRAKMNPGELAALQERLRLAKEQFQSLQERTEVAQKELESTVTAAMQQETEKVKAAKELEENRSKIESLLNWVTSLEQTGELSEHKPRPMEQALGALEGKSTQDIRDGHLVEVDGVEESLDGQYERLKARHQELLSQQQDVILATQTAQAFLDKQGHNLAPEERQRLQGRLAELKEQYAANLSQSEKQLKQVQVLRDELQKFMRDHGEFEAWLEQAEQELERMHKADSDPESLRPMLLRQGSFSEDVISHKGDLRFVTMSGQKVLDAESAAKEEGPEPLATGNLVKSKLDDATKRYTALHSKCAKLGSHLNALLDRYQQFQEVAETLRTWLQESEAAVAKVLSETVSSDPAILQKQLTNAKQLQGDLAEHQVPVEKLQKAARSLLEIEGEPAPDRRRIQETTDSIVSRFQSLSGQMAGRSDLLQKSIAQSQSVQEGLETLVQSMAEIEKSLEGEQLASLSSLSIQESLATNAKLKQDIARQKSSLEATREMVTRFMETANSSTASALQGKLAEVTEHFNKLCRRQQEKENVLKGLLPKVEQYEHLSEKLQQFTESRARMLASGNQPDRDIAHFSQQIQELNLEMRQHQEDLDTIEGLTAELSSFGFPVGSSQHQAKVQSLKQDFVQLQKAVKEREKDASSCQEQLDEFRKLVGAIKKWLKESEGNVPSAETSLGTQELEKRMQQIKVLLEEWTGKGAQVEEINHKGTALENLIVEITAPDAQSKTGSVLPALGVSVGSVNGYHTCKDLTEIQCDMSDVNQQYEGLGMVLRERQEQLSAMLEKMLEVQEEASSVLKWLESKERTLSALEASSSPTKTETMRAQAEHNKVTSFLAELEQNSGKIQKVKEALSGLLEKCPDSPEAANWQKMLDDLNSRWARANQVTAERQQKLEKSANQLASFQAAEAQLRPWLMEKELMMSVLGPLSIDPNMLNAQKQQVQFMLKEFEARRQQQEQLNQAAQGILISPGDDSPSSNQVREELQGVNQKWTELTERLNSRSSQIDQAIVKSTQYQELLRDLSEKVKAIGQRFSSQSAVSTQPDAVKQQLEETSEIRSDLGQLEEEIMEAQTLCDELSVLIGEQYLKDELRKRLETVALPLKGLEDLAADRMNRLQTALASSQQFQHMFDELRTWLDDKLCQQAQSRPISAKLERLQCQIQEQEEFQKSLNQHSGSYEMIVAEGESLLLSVQPGEEKTALQSQLVGLKTHWDELSKQVTDRNSRLKDCLQKAQKYQRHMEDLLPWVEDCRTKMSELEVTLDPVQLEAGLLRSKAMLSDVEKRRSLLEMLNSAADILIDACQTDEDEVRDEKAGINQKMDAITEELQAKTGSTEEMSQRLKEFQENFKNIEKKLEGAKHQLEIYDALGPQACSNKNLEKLRAQQEVLQALEPQVDYLKNFTQGLVEDAPDGSDCSQLLRQAEDSQQDFKIVKQRVNECCSLMETKLEGIGQFNNHVREMFSQLADLDDELDSMGAIGRDIDSLQSQAEDVRTFLGRLQGLKSDIEASEEECRHMLEDEGSPDLLGLKRELETLNKQCSKLTERGKNRQEQVETTLSRVEDFYDKLKELNHMASAAEENEALQWIVGTEVETIRQQLADFKDFHIASGETLEPIKLWGRVWKLYQMFISVTEIAPGKPPHTKTIERNLKGQKFRQRTIGSLPSHTT
ncbi:Microtubule-actin cross-linking factor 1, isoforms 1/2/3/5 [Chelonia mydas]|uniref:Microtubule-actin cross-linking factor 1, isoforms 1/2/3/5 n=1 Tax=Chelonia mydas TaxID=8469 RepID=M7B8E8_CHEMY|nr:Microtubule-actin cross-linking factor 1, isoforms 1/2/3/5 [Chelonia mydas]